MSKNHLIFAIGFKLTGLIPRAMPEKSVSNSRIDVTIKFPAAKTTIEMPNNNISLMRIFKS